MRNDVSVPVAKVPELIRRASDAFKALIPNSPSAVRPPGLREHPHEPGQPEARTAQEFLGHSAAITASVNAIVDDLGGSFAAEHGIGLLKVGILESSRSSAELDTMRHIKAALDPLGLMSPGKVLRR